MAHYPTPMLFFSSFFDREGMHSRIDALAAGALDVVEKPTLMPDDQWTAQAGALAQKVKSLAQVPVVTHIRGAHVQARQRPIAAARAASAGTPVDVVAIGVSTGGPRVLDELLSSLPPAFDAVGRRRAAHGRGLPRRADRVAATAVSRAHEGRRRRGSAFCRAGCSSRRRRAPDGAVRADACTSRMRIRSWAIARRWT